MFKNIKRFKSVISYKLGSRQNNSSSPLSFFFFKFDQILIMDPSYMDLLENLIYRCKTLYIIRDSVWHWELFEHLQYRALTWRQMSHHYGYAEKNCLFSVPSDLLLILPTLLLKSYFHHNFRNIMKKT